jgi:hypothetical protein
LYLTSKQLSSSINHESVENDGGNGDGDMNIESRGIGEGLARLQNGRTAQFNLQDKKDIPDHGETHDPNVESPTTTIEYSDDDEDQNEQGLSLHQNYIHCVLFEKSGSPKITIIDESLTNILW